MAEIACNLAVESDALHTQPFEKLGHDHSTDRIDRIHDHLEACCLDGRHIDCLQRENGIEVLIGEIVLADRAEILDCREVEILFLRKIENLLPFSCSKELTLAVEELESVPLLGIVGGCDDDSAVRSGQDDRHLCGRCRSQSCLDYIDSAGNEGAYNEILHHFPGHSCIPAHNYLVPGPAFLLRFAGRQSGAVGVGELYYINRGQPVSRLSPNGSPDSGDRFYK